jgi:hypothetical protein
VNVSSGTSAGRPRYSISLSGIFCRCAVVALLLFAVVAFALGVLVLGALAAG